jgi:hypothetical protein
MMDYIGRNGSTFHLNWAGHSYMYSLLSQLGADLTEWSDFNDGEYISERTCKEWAALLKRNMSRLSELSEDKEKWILDFASFLDQCGGCNQY